MYFPNLCVTSTEFQSPDGSPRERRDERRCRLCLYTLHSNVGYTKTLPSSSFEEDGRDGDLFEASLAFDEIDVRRYAALFPQVSPHDAP